MITKKERNLIKGAIRRVFSRSETRREALADAQIQHYDPKRPRVTKWGRCEHCKKPEALYKMQADHIEPVVPISMSLEDMSWDEIINRIFCNKNNLQILCLGCHSSKSKSETKQRAQARKERKNGKRT